MWNTESTVLILNKNQANTSPSLTDFPAFVTIIFGQALVIIKIKLLYWPPCMREICVLDILLVWTTGGTGLWVWPVALYIACTHRVLSFSSSVAKVTLSPSFTQLKKYFPPKPSASGGKDFIWTYKIKQNGYKIFLILCFTLSCTCIVLHNNIFGGKGDKPGTCSQ